MRNDTNKSLFGKVAIVTGGGNGIGKAMVLEFAREGAKVIAADVDFTALKEAVKTREDLAEAILMIIADVTCEQDVEHMVSQTIGTFGTVDILVNNAGLRGPSALIADTPKQAWDQVINVNLCGAFLCSKAAARHMITNKSGSIVNVSSPAGKKGTRVQAIPYAVSKYGLEGLTYILASQLKPYNICVNGMRPPRTDTAMIIDRSPQALATLRQPEEISKLALFLAAQSAMTMTGEIVDFEEWEKTERAV